jgi:hypothetical protein
MTSSMSHPMTSSMSQPIAFQPIKSEERSDLSIIDYFSTETNGEETLTDNDTNEEETLTETEMDNGTNGEETLTDNETNEEELLTDNETNGEKILTGYDTNGEEILTEDCLEVSDDEPLKQKKNGKVKDRRRNTNKRETVTDRRTNEREREGERERRGNRKQQLTVVGKKAYSCKDCGKSCKTSSGFVVHVMFFHYRDQVIDE